jgi:ribonuclease HI
VVTHLTWEMYQEALKSLKVGSAAPEHDLPVAIFRWLPQSIQAWLFKGLGYMLQERWVIPAHLLESITIYLYKGKGDPTIIQSYRGIAVMGGFNKLEAAVLRIMIGHEAGVKGLIPKTQAANQKMQTTQQVLLGLQAWLARRGRQGGWLLLIDFQRAFDSINLDIVEVLLTELGFAPLVRDAFLAMYVEHSTRILTMDGLTDRLFLRRVGLRQGCPCSPLVFSLVLAPLLWSLESQYLNQELALWAFADDLTMGGGNLAILQLKLDQVEYMSIMLGLTISRTKSVVVPFGRPPDPSGVGLQWRDGSPVSLQEALTVRILGVWMALSMDPRDMLNQVIHELVHTFRGALQAPTSWKSRVRIVNSILVPRLAYRLQQCLWSDVQLREVDQKLTEFVMTGSGSLTQATLRTPYPALGVGLFSVATRVKVSFMQTVQNLLKGWGNQGVSQMLYQHARRMTDRPQCERTSTSHPLAIFAKLASSVGWGSVWGLEGEVSPFGLEHPHPPIKRTIEPQLQGTAFFEDAQVVRVPGTRGGDVSPWRVNEWSLQCDGWYTQAGPLVSEPDVNWLRTQALEHGCITFIQKWEIWLQKPSQMQRIFTDGSAKDERAASGIWVPGSKRVFAQRPPGAQEPGRAELWAVIGALKKAAGPVWIITDYQYIERILYSTLSQRLHHVYADLVEPLYQLWKKFPWDIWVTWVKGHISFGHHEVADMVAKAGCARPPTVPRFSPVDYGDLSQKGTEIWGVLITRFLKQLAQVHDWRGVDQFWSFRVITKPTLVSLGRLKWVSGTQDWLNGAFAYHLEYKQVRECRACGGRHPADFLSTMALCPTFTKYLEGFFALFEETELVVRQWWNRVASSEERRLWVRSLIPSSLVGPLLKSVSRKRLKEIMENRFKQWQKTHQELMRELIDKPPPSPLGRAVNTGSSPKRGQEEMLGMGEAEHFRLFKKKLDTWAGRAGAPPSQPPPRPRGRGRGDLSLGVLRKQRPKGRATFHPRGRGRGGRGRDM